MKTWFLPLLRVMLAAIFIAAGVPKILNPESFALVIFRYQLLPGGAINLLAIFLPWLELVAGVSILTHPRWREPAALLILGMLLVFAGAMTINIFRGLDVGCGCFSVDPRVSRLGWVNVVRNLLLIVVTAIVWRDCRGRGSLPEARAP